ncbi:MAG: O-antigen ligase family protein [Lachnospiraceae bacterium]|nr:O-antigen ligase family protein [Lachnospiraceae bacterium]
MGNSGENKQQSKGMDIPNVIMGIYAFVVLCIFPVVYDNFYFNILETKYRFYCIVSFVMMAAMLVYGLYTNKMIEYLKVFKLGKLIKSLTLVDWAILEFWLAHVLSWMNCDFPWEAFWGTSGRFNGVFLISIYTVVYFLVTRFFKVKRIYLDAFLVISIFVCLFGISDYFQMDLLGFKERMMDEQKSQYTSTLGNINTYTVYVGAVLCVSMLLFTLESCMKRTAFYAGVMAVAMVALIVGASDNAYLTLAALYGFSPLWLFRTKTGVRRYMASIAMFLTATLFVGWINVEYAEMVYGLGGIFGLISGMSILLVGTIALWFVVGVWTFLSAKGQAKHTDELGKALRYIWVAIIFAVVAAVAFVLYDANLAGNAERYEVVKSYVVFNDSWGTGRGYAWKCAIELYTKIFTPAQQLFGFGADTFKLQMIMNFPAQNGTVYDSVHNEYLNFLNTIGLFGLLAWMMCLGTAIVQMVKNLKDRPETAAILFVVLAYATQAVVNINLPVIFPLIFQLLAMGISKDSKE